MDKNEVKNIVIEETQPAIKVLYYSTFFFIKHFFSSKLWWVLIFVIPTVIVVGMGVLIPFKYAFIASIGTDLVMTTLMIYGALFFSIRKSSLYENMRLTVLSFVAIYSALLFSTFIINFFVFTFLMILYCGFIELQIVFPLDWFWNPGNATGANETTIVWNDVWWTVIFYFFIISTALNFSVSYLLQNLTSTQKTYYITSFLYFFVFIIWSGSITVVENIYVSDGSIYLNENFHHPSNWFFWMRWFNPNWGINQFAFSSFASATQVDGQYIIPGINEVSPWAWSDDALWNLDKFLSIIWIGFLTGVGFFINIFKYKYWK